MHGGDQPSPTNWMSSNQRSNITPLELDAAPRSAVSATEQPHAFDAPQAADDESAALLDGTHGPSSGAQPVSSLVPRSRHRRALVLAATAATLCLLLTFAVTATSVGRRAWGAAVSAVAPPPDQAAAPPTGSAAPQQEAAYAPSGSVAPQEEATAPPSDAGVAWGMSIYDVPVPQDVPMPPYTTDVRPCRGTI